LPHHTRPLLIVNNWTPLGVVQMAVPLIESIGRVMFSPLAQAAYAVLHVAWSQESPVGGP